MTASSPPRRSALEGIGTPALALGVIAVGVSWLGWPGVGVGVVAVVLGFVGARRAFSDPTRNGGAALGGFVLGLAGLIVGAVVVWPSVFGSGTFGEGLSLDQCMGAARGAQEQQVCASQHLQEYRARYPGSVNMGG